jgi:hypothetical protein
MYPGRLWAHLGSPRLLPWAGTTCPDKSGESGAHMVCWINSDCISRFSFSSLINFALFIFLIFNSILRAWE